MSSDGTDTKTRILEQTWHLLEQHRGQVVRIEDVASAVGISRQALYLHFHSRVELLIATARYADQMSGLEMRLASFRQAVDGRETLLAFVDFWGNYIPAIHGLARALLSARETDRAASAAWDDRMNALREGCQCVIDCLERENLLSPLWEKSIAVDMISALVSIPLWENLTLDQGWSQEEYLRYIKTALQQIFAIPSNV